MPLMLTEAVAIRAGIPKGEIEMAKKTPRPIPKGTKLPNMKTFSIVEPKD